MPSMLQEMRKAAGFKSAASFAEAMDIPAATYARYEQTPEKIPTANAWAIADRLGCGIDDVVGRAEHVVVALGYDEAQGIFDGLSEDGKRIAYEFLTFLKERDAERASRRGEDEMRRYEATARRYEAMYLADIGSDPDRADLAVFGSREQLRRGYFEYVCARAKGSRERKVADAMKRECAKRGVEYSIAALDGEEDSPASSRADATGLYGAISRECEREDEAKVAKIMEAYDRIHAANGSRIEYSYAVL